MKIFSVVFVSILTLVMIVSLNTLYAGSQKSDDLSQKNPEMKSLQNDTSLSGKVVETMNSGGYTYVHLEKDGKEVWVAVPKMKVTVGLQMSFRHGMVMNNFRSKTLDRTFETIVFSEGVIEKD